MFARGIIVVLSISVWCITLSSTVGPDTKNRFSYGPRLVGITIIVNVCIWSITPSFTSYIRTSNVCVPSKVVVSSSNIVSPISHVVCE